MKARIHILVFGDVQGVFFRANTQGEGGRLGVSGWVRNLPDGSVEVLAEGEKEALEALLDWCRHGPAGASVGRVEPAWLQFRGNLHGFRVKYG
ncbi:MAG: acylphosphatase [Candidatus Micrarchaeota archaeon]